MPSICSPESEIWELSKRKRRKIIRHILTIWLLFCLGGQILAQDVVSPTQIRDFDTSKIKELKDSGDFEYIEAPVETPSFVDRIWRFIRDLINSILDAATGTTLGQVVTYLLGFILLLLAIIKLAGMNPRDVFYNKGDRGQTKFEFLEENIHSLDFDKLLSKALAKEDFRLAIRLTYLKTLKHLSDRLIVVWEDGKTNYDYLYEISDPELKNHFRDLSYYFDYAWYGDFEVNEPIYTKAAQSAATIVSSAKQPIPETA